MLADLSYELDNSAAAQSWIDRALGSIERFPELNTHFSLWIIRVVGAIYSDDFASANNLFHEAERHGLFEGSELRERWRSALRARLALAKGAFSLRDTELARIYAALNNIHPMSGALDFEVATICEYLISVERGAEARDLLDQLTCSSRRNRAALSREVRRVSKLLVEMAR
jgi:hypothetical protein